MGGTADQRRFRLTTLCGISGLYLGQALRDDQHAVHVGTVPVVGRLARHFAHSAEQAVIPRCVQPHHLSIERRDAVLLQRAQFRHGLSLSAHPGPGPSCLPVKQRTRRQERVRALPAAQIDQIWTTMAAAPRAASPTRNGGSSAHAVPDGPAHGHSRISARASVSASRRLQDPRGRPG
jgi:hypothetical protein